MEAELWVMPDIKRLTISGVPSQAVVVNVLSILFPSLLNASLAKIL